MKNYILLCLMGLFSVACVTNKQQVSSIPYGNAERVLNECVKISETGDIFELLKLIKQDTNRVLKIVEQKPTESTEIRLQELIDEIKKNSDLVIELTKEEWNTNNVRHEINWTLNDEDFGSKNLFTYEPKVVKVYSQGKERPDLVRLVNISQTGNDYSIKYMNAATMLEYCQLNETLMIVLEVKYYGFRSIKKKYFNLHVNLEK